PIRGTGTTRCCAASTICGSPRPYPTGASTTRSTSCARSASQTAAGRCRSAFPACFSSKWRNPAGTVDGTRARRSESSAAVTGLRGLYQLDEPEDKRGEGAGKQEKRQRGGSHGDELQLQRDECQREEDQRSLLELGPTLPEPPELERDQLPTGA